MNKTDLTRRLARAAHTSRAEAADYLDQAVLAILKRWKHGEMTDWPGLGVFSRDLAQPRLSKPAKKEAV
jgi:nucleoid DNA-binding protein